MQYVPRPPGFRRAIESNYHYLSRHRSRHGRGRRYRARVRQCSRGQARLDRFPSRAKTGPMLNWFPQLPRGSRKNSQKRNTTVQSRGAVRMVVVAKYSSILGLLRIFPDASRELVPHATAIQGVLVPAGGAGSSPGNSAIKVKFSSSCSALVNVPSTATVIAFSRAENSSFFHIGINSISHNDLLRVIVIAEALCEFHNLRHLRLGSAYPIIRSETNRTIEEILLPLSIFRVSVIFSFFG